MYGWHLTRDAGSADVLLGVGNPLRKFGGIAFNKSYNVHKVLYDTPLKGLGLFQLPALEGLAYGQELLSEWAEAHRLGSRGMKKFERSLLIQTFQAIKARLRTACQGSPTFGVRQEYRLLFSLFQQLDPRQDYSAQLPHNDASDGHHRPYWILPASGVQSFITADVNRWILGIEFLISRGDPAAVAVGGLSIGREAQMLNGAMLAALLRTLRAVLGGEDISRDLSLARREYDGKRRIRDARAGSGFRWIKTGVKRFGLGYEESIVTNGVAGLPSSLIFWGSLSFRAEKLRRMIFEYSTLGEIRRQARTAHDTIMRDEALVRLLGDSLVPLTAEQRNLNYDEEDHLRTSFVMMTELIVQQYIRDILQLVLLPRAIADCQHGDNVVRQRSKRLVDKLSDVESYNLDGFAPFPLASFLGFRPYAVAARPPHSSGHTRNGAVTHFPDYNQQGWRDWAGKLQGLFEWGDDRDPKKLRGWDHYPFRRLVRRFYGLVVQQRGEAMAARFLEELGDNAGQYLWMIPNYDHDHIAVMRKASSHHTAETRREIQSQSQLEKTTWLAACFEAGSVLARQVEIVNQHFRRGQSGEQLERYRMSAEQLSKSQDDIRQGVEGGFMMVWEGKIGIGTQWLSRGLIHGEWYGMDLHLTQAEEINVEIEEQIEELVDEDINSEEEEEEEGSE
jgi:hypothetical protein